MSPIDLISPVPHWRLSCGIGVPSAPSIASQGPAMPHSIGRNMAAELLRGATWAEPRGCAAESPPWFDVGCCFGRKPSLRVWGVWGGCLYSASVVRVMFKEIYIYKYLCRYIDLYLYIYICVCVCVCVF